LNECNHIEEVSQLLLLSKENNGLTVNKAW
jgi:hypothetical protein